VAPVNPPVYSPSDAAAFINVQLADIVVGVTYEFFTEWRDPSGDLCNECGHASGLLTFNVNAATLSDSIQIAGRTPASRLGVWAVEVLVSPGGVSPISLTTSSFTVGSTGPTVPTYSVTVGVSPGDAASNAGLSVDGQAVGSGRQYSWSQGEQHSLSVKKVVPGSTSGVQYVFTGWSDGVSAETRQISVSGNMALTAQYKTQYWLTVSSDHGSASGEGWYDEGSRANAELDTGTISDGLFYNWVFAGWTDDAKGTNLKSGAITMDGPKTATASWNHELSTTLYAVVAVAVAAVAVAVFLMMKRGKGPKPMGQAPSQPQMAPPEPKLSGEKKFCGNCRAVLPVEAKVCSSCGQPA